MIHIGVREKVLRFDKILFITLTALFERVIW